MTPNNSALKTKGTDADRALDPPVAVVKAELVNLATVPLVTAYDTTVRAPTSVWSDGVLRATTCPKSWTLPFAVRLFTYLDNPARCPPRDRPVDGSQARTF
ncbi:hypothetical protein [Acinetobacter sp.]|uniref:hypothetical protein n=1 Tax=Acinetobacter sp. TaxID=472 RepID=UPI00257DFD6C|nr:hypothetical protein [Acinetobacter sp.]